MNSLRSWFHHPGGGLCWRRVVAVTLNVAMFGWVALAIAGVTGGARYWVVWWTIVALGLVVAECPHHARNSTESHDLAPRGSTSGPSQNAIERHDALDQ